MKILNVRARTQPLSMGLYGLAAVVLVALIAWPQVAQVFGGQRDFYIGLVTGALITTMLTISLNLAMGFAGLLSFIHTGLLAVGGYTVGVTTIKYGLSPWLSILIAVVGVTFLCIVISLISVRATNIYWGLITLSFDLVVIQVAQQWSSITGGFNGLPGVPRPSLNGVQLDDVKFFYLCLAAAIITYIVTRNIVLSPSGRAFMAVRQSPETASSLGINPARARLLAFAISGALAGLAGALYAQNLNFISAEVANQGPQLALFIAIFLGGFGTLLGPVLGMVVVTIVQNQIRGLGSNALLILGLFLLASILILPRGIIGTWTSSRFFERYQTGRRTRRSADADAKPAVPLEVLLGQESDRIVISTDTPDMPVLSTTGVSKAFGGVLALQHVDFDLRPREVHGLIGPNGAGKSTLGSCITGYIQRDSGDVLLRGEKLPRSPDAVALLGITRVFQTPHLLESATVIENILTGMYSRTGSNWLSAIFRTPGYRVGERERRAEALELLRSVGLLGLADRSASSLSHGQKRLVEIVRAVAMHPDVLILDEPATGLAKAELVQLDAMLRALRDAGLSMLLIEHNMEFVMSLCDRITVLSFGQVIAHGGPDEISSSLVVREAYLGGTAA